MLSTVYSTWLAVGQHFFSFLGRLGMGPPKGRETVFLIYRKDNCFMTTA